MGGLPAQCTHAPQHSDDEQVGKEEYKLSAEVLDKFAELITFALGLVAALAWNEAIQQLFTQLLGEAGGGFAAQVVFAVIFRLIVLFSTIAVSRAAERAKQREAERGRA